MGRINNRKIYPLDTGISLEDTLIGSDFEDSNKTKNFEVRGLLNTINEANGISSLNYKYAPAGVKDARAEKGYFNTNTPVLSSVTSIIFNKLDADDRNLDSILDILNANKQTVIVCLKSPAANGSFLYFSLLSATEELKYYTFEVLKVGSLSRGLLVNESTFVLGYVVSNKIKDGHHSITVRAGSRETITPLDINPINGDTAEILLGTGKLQKWSYTSNEWRKIFTLEATTRHYVINRNIENEDVAPLSFFEVPNPMSGDTAVVNLSSGKFEEWNYNGTSWSKSFTVDYRTNLGFRQLSNEIIITSSTGGGTVIVLATSTLAGLMSPFDKSKLDTFYPNLLSNFTGTIIPDNPNANTALQALETAIEANSRHYLINRVGEPIEGLPPFLIGEDVAPFSSEVPTPMSGDTAVVKQSSVTFENWIYNGTSWSKSFTVNTSTNLSVTTRSGSIDINSSTGSHATILLASSIVAGLMSPFDKSKLDTFYPNLLSNFTGTIIPDNPNANTALQALETAIEANSRHYVINRGDETEAVEGLPFRIPEDVAPLSSEVPTPMSGDTAVVNLSSGKFENWIYNGTSWSKSFTVDYKTNLGARQESSQTVLTSSTGSSATILLANSISAGLLSPTEKNKLFFITVSRAVDLVAVDVRARSGYNGLIDSRTINLTPSTTPTTRSFQADVRISATQGDGVTFTDAVDGLKVEVVIPPTDLTTSYTPNTVTLISSTGDNTQIVHATRTRAGVISSADQFKLDTYYPNLLSSFTGSIIPDDSNANTALQALETAIEGIVFPPTNLSYVSRPNRGTIVSSTGSDVILPQVSSSASGLMSRDDKIKLDTYYPNLLDNFTGTIIPNNANANTALQALETAIEAGMGDGNNTPIGRANAVENVEPTATEVANPVRGDTADIRLNSGKLEKWFHNGTIWAKAFTINYNDVTDLSVTTRSASIDINSSTGSRATIFLANSISAGLISPTEKNKLDFITVSREVDLVAVDVRARSGYNGLIDSRTINLTPSTTPTTRSFQADVRISATQGDGVTFTDDVDGLKVEVVIPPTDLSITTHTDGLRIFSSTGEPVFIALTNRFLAGLMSPAQKQKLDTYYPNLLSSFTGSIIPDDSNANTALQALETAIEEIVIPPTDLTTSYTPNTVTINSSTGDNTQIVHATRSRAGVISSADQFKLDTYYPELATAFLGSTIPLNANVHIALQSLETAVERRPTGYLSKEAATAALGTGKIFRYLAANFDGAGTGTVAWT